MFIFYKLGRDILGTLCDEPFTTKMQPTFHLHNQEHTLCDKQNKFEINSFFQTPLDKIFGEPIVKEIIYIKKGKIGTLFSKKS